jgi:hypothetical protein
MLMGLSSHHEKQELGDRLATDLDRAGDRPAAQVPGDFDV